MSEKSLPVPRLVDIAVALRERGRNEEADYYGVIFPQMISILYGIDVNELLTMTVDDVSRLSLPPEKPAKYNNWDNFWFGRAAFVNSG